MTSLRTFNLDAAFNMMYLVFIAMLALNISKEVLATLGLINDDISQATKDLVDRGEIVLADGTGGADEMVS